MKILDHAIESALGISDMEMEVFYDSVFPGIPPDRGSIICLDYEKGGRTGYAASMGFNPIHKLPYMRVFEPFQENSLGKDVADSFNNFSGYYRKLNYIFASGSGESKIPALNMKEDLIPNYGFGSTKTGIISNPEKNKKAPTLSIITSNPKSTLGSFVSENSGNIVLINGREEETKKGTGVKYLEDGIMEDRFELASNIFTGGISKGIVNSVDPFEFTEYYRGLMDEAMQVKQEVEKRMRGAGYQKLIEHITDPEKKIILCGQGIGHTAAKFNNNRLGHVCGLANQLSDDYKNGISPKRNDTKWGSSPLQADKNSLVVVISESGKKNAKDFIETAIKSKSGCVFITKDGDSDYSGVDIIRIPDAFYLGVNMLLTASNVDAAYRMDRMGVEVSEESFRNLHVKDKLSY